MCILTKNSYNFDNSRRTVIAIQKSNSYTCIGFSSKLSFNWSYKCLTRKPWYVFVIICADAIHQIIMLNVCEVSVSKCVSCCAECFVQAILS